MKGRERKGKERKGKDRTRTRTGKEEEKRRGGGAPSWPFWPASSRKSISTNPHLSVRETIECIGNANIKPITTTCIFYAKLAPPPAEQLPPGGSSLCTLPHWRYDPRDGGLDVWVGNAPRHTIHGKVLATRMPSHIPAAKPKSWLDPHWPCPQPTVDNAVQEQSRLPSSFRRLVRIWAVCSRSFHATWQMA